jgi:non-ribosomal peptide synthetase component E (peptide arylation enzyme)
VIFQFTDFGCIEDVALGLRWSPADFESEVMNRATALAAAKVKLGSTVVVAHSGSARFFADLFAVWTLDRTAACIDPALTANEVETLIEFVEPSAVLVDQIPFGARIAVPVLQLADVPAPTISVPNSTGQISLLLS